MSPGAVVAKLACFGAHLSAVAEDGILLRDLHPKNLLLGEEGIKVLDEECIHPYPFPGEISIYALALFTVLSDLPRHLGAAIRYGYLNHAGNLGRLVFEHLRQEHGVVPWPGFPWQFELEEQVQAAWLQEHDEWRQRRDTLSLPPLGVGPSLLSRQGALAFDLGQALRASDPHLALYAFERQVIVDVASSDSSGFHRTVRSAVDLARRCGDEARARTWQRTLLAVEQDGGEVWPELVFWEWWSNEEEGRIVDQGPSDATLS